MAENSGDKGGSNLLPTETSRIPVFRDTVILPPTDGGEYIHIDTTSAALAFSFGQFAEHFDTSSDEARRFWQNKVNFRLGKPVSPPVSFKNRLDATWARAWNGLMDRIGSREVLLGGVVVVPEQDDRCTVWIDTQSIASVLPYAFRSSVFNVANYEAMIIEERVAAFQQMIKTCIQHEFYHLLEHMRNPTINSEVVRKEQLKSRLLFLLVTLPTASIVLPDVMNLTPETRLAGIIAGLIESFALSKVIVRLDNGTFKIVEADAYKAQKHARSLDIRSPFNFIHESTPNPDRGK